MDYLLNYPIYGPTNVVLNVVLNLIINGLPSKHKKENPWVDSFYLQF